MAVDIAIESPLQDDVRLMVAALNAHMIPLTPREFQFQLTVEQMAEPGVTVFVARDAAGRAVGMASLKDHGGGLGEVKGVADEAETDQPGEDTSASSGLSGTYFFCEGVNPP